MTKDKRYFSDLIKTRGWTVSGALLYWGRSYDWYHRNCNGSDAEHNRLECMTKGLPGTEDEQRELKDTVRHLAKLCGIAGEVS